MQITSRASLRDGVAALKAQFTNLYPLGVKLVARSTFADAMNRRPAAFFEALFASCISAARPMPPATSSSSKTSFIRDYAAALATAARKWFWDLSR